MSDVALRTAPPFGGPSCCMYSLYVMNKCNNSLKLSIATVQENFDAFESCGIERHFITGLLEVCSMYAYSNQSNTRLFAARRSNSFYSGICHRMRVGRADGRTDGRADGNDFEAS